MKKILLIVMLLLICNPYKSFAETENTKIDDTEVTVVEEENDEEGLDIPYGVGLLILGIIIFNNNRQMNI